MASGNLDLNNSTIKQSNIDLKVGDLTFTEMTINNLKANLAVGSVESNDTLFTNSDLSIALGDYSGNNLVFNGHNKLDVTSGDVEISLKSHTVMFKLTVIREKQRLRITLRTQKIIHLPLPLI